MRKTVLHLVPMASAVILLAAACGTNDSPQVVSTAGSTSGSVKAASVSDVGDLPSWDLILNEGDLSAYRARIYTHRSEDTDYREGNALIFGNTVEAEDRHSTSHHRFDSRLGDIEIELEAFREPRYAELQMEMEMWSDTHRFDLKTRERSSLHNYPVQASSDTIKENPFWSRTIHLDEAIGERTVCSQWKDFAPKLRFSMGHVLAMVSVGDFGMEHLDDAIVIAKMQEGKLRRLMGDGKRTR